MKRLAAAIIFFTRLPLWRIVNPPQSAYTDVVAMWPVTGWITGYTVALAMFVFSYVMPWITAIVLALAVRLLLTGALHEDGLADFCDAFGCGGDRGRMLSIMKDSHIGTYGVIGLMVYFLFTVTILYEMPVTFACLVYPAADTFAKLSAAQLINFLPYARPEGAKNGISYSRMSVTKFVFCFVAGVIPAAVAAWFVGYGLLLACFFPIAAVAVLIGIMRRRIGGYTGDCCGAAYLICESSFLLGVTMILWLMG